MIGRCGTPSLVIYGSQRSARLISSSCFRWLAKKPRTCLGDL